MTPANQIQIGLTTLVQAWDRRLRLQQTVAWMSRALIVGLSVSVVAGVLSRWRPLLDRTELLMFSGLALVFAVIALIAYVWGRERGTVESARRFDLAFGLQERVSTALELIEGRIRADETLTLLQTEDAYTHAQTIKADERLRFEVNRNEWFVVAGLVAMLAMLVIVPNTVAQDLPIDPERVEIIAAGEDAIEDAVETVATDTSLDQETRDSLLEALEANLAILQDEAISADEALAIMGDVERLLQAESDRLREQSESDQQALSSAAEALNGNPPEQPGQAQEGEQEQGTEGETGDPLLLEELIKQTKDALENMESQSSTREEQEEAQAAMSENMQSAGEIEALSPELSQALQDASEAIQQGDMQGAQEALQRAEDLAQQQQSQAEQTEQSAQNLDEAAQDMQQAQQQGTPQSSQNSGQQQQQQQGQQSGQEGAQGEASEGTEGQQPSEQGQGQAQNGQGETQPGDPQGQQTGEGDPASEEAQLGTGQEGGDLSPDTRGQVNSEQFMPSQSQPGEEREYEQIFDPSRINGAGTGSVELEGDPEGAPIREGDFSDNPTGNALVPYNEVFSDYANAANEALDSSYIPLGLRDVVRDYFSSLSPSRTSSDSD